MAGGAIAQRIEWSTYDFAENNSTPVGGGERWADVKTPGDGRIYAAGTARVSDTRPSSNPSFSGAPVASTLGVPASTGSRQVGVVQVTDEQGNIAWQRYFHGEAFGQTNGLSTTIRGIAVLPAEADQFGRLTNTRVVICGDTFDDLLPEIVTPQRGGPTQTLNEPYGGFIAVYDGEGQILWSHRFHGQDLFAETIITDVLVHREGPPAARRDVITYCGASTNGAYVDTTTFNPPVSTMSPLRFHAAPTAWAGGFPTAGNFHDNAAGVTLQSSGNWDGFVGRISMPSSGPYDPANLTRQFHSIVGGGFDDTLWGIAQRDENRFAVVGVTDIQVPSIGTVTDVPLTRPLAFNSATPVNFHGGGWTSFGTVFEFDASATRTGGNLALVGSTLLGSFAEATVARDIRWDDERI